MQYILELKNILSIKFLENKIMKGMVERMIEQEKGITLVALVITVIIIIILATVTINIALGDNGLIKQAELAKKLSENSTTHEMDAMANLVAYMNEVRGGNNGQVEKGYGITINSNLTTYNQSLGEFTAIYSIAGTKDGETVYQDMISITASKAGIQSTKLNIDVPAGTTLRIETIYYGASYDLTSGNNQTVEISEENPEQTVTFSYEYNGKLVGTAI